MRQAVFLCVFLTAAATVHAQDAPAPFKGEPGSGVFVQQPAMRMYPGPGTLEFERTRLDFAPQSTGIQNCSNIAVTNTTDHPRLLTRLVSLDPKHFSVPSPTQEMLPLTLGANSSLYINICFKTDEVKSYHTRLLAIFQTDTVRLDLNGRGVALPAVVPVPKESGITSVTYKNHKWMFQFGTSSRSVVRLELENAMGKAIRTFPLEGEKTPGYYEVAFDGKGDDGKKLAKGSYILRLEIVDLDSKKTLHSSKLVTIK